MSTITERSTIDRIIAERPEQLRGFTVVARDGEAGVVDGDQSPADDTHLMVKIGGFLGLFSKEVVVEAETIDAISPEAQEIHVDRIVDWVRSSPTPDNASGAQ